MCFSCAVPSLCHNPPMSENRIIGYLEVAEALQRAASPADASDSHGFMCGLICANGFADPKLWLGDVFDDFNPRDLLQTEAFKLLQALYENTMVHLNSPDLDFELLLPDEEQPLRERTEALGNWCSGFLSGLGAGGIPDQDSLSDEVRDMLSDMSDISKVDFDLDDPDEEELVAFEEVVEYIRVGVLFIHEELQPAKAPPQMQ